MPPPLVSIHHDQGGAEDLAAEGHAHIVQHHLVKLQGVPQQVIQPLGVDGWSVICALALPVEIQLPIQHGTSWGSCWSQASSLPLLAGEDLL